VSAHCHTVTLSLSSLCHTASLPGEDVASPNQGPVPLISLSHPSPPFLLPPSPSPLCSYILMAEPDHIIVKPIPNMATQDMPCGYPFFYITPRTKKVSGTYAEQKPRGSPRFSENA